MPTGLASDATYPLGLTAQNEGNAIVLWNLHEYQTGSANFSFDFDMETEVASSSVLPFRAVPNRKLTIRL